MQDTSTTPGAMSSTSTTQTAQKSPPQPTSQYRIPSDTEDYDSETGLYYLQSRYYDPVTHRFLNTDGLIDNRGVSTQNLFSYCVNNPVIYVDNTGTMHAMHAGLGGYPNSSQDFSTINDVIGFLVDSTDTMLTTLYSILYKSVSNSPKPNNIGAGTWNKAVQAQLDLIDDFAKVTNSFINFFSALGVIADVGISVYDNVSAGASFDKILIDAGIDFSISLGGVIASGFIGAKVGACAGNVAPGYGNAIGAGAGFIVGIVISFITDGISIKGKTIRSWIKEGVY